MRKIKLIAIIAGLFTGYQVYSQQIPMYNLYYFDQFLYNPSLAGMKAEGPNVFGLFRNQWNNMPGSPQTDIFSIDGAIKKKKIGLGGIIENDKTDLITRTSISLAYSYLINLDVDQTISLGLMMGFVNQNIDFNKVTAYDPNDVALYTNNYRDMGFDGAAGLNYSFRKLNIGFAIPQLISTTFTYADYQRESNFKPVQHFLISAQYSLDVKKDILTFDPLAMYKVQKVPRNQLDLGGIFCYKNFAWLGATWRHDYSVYFVAGLKIHDALQFGYSYEWVNNEIYPFAGSTHEIILGFSFNKNKASLEKKLSESKSRIDSLQNKLTVLSENVGNLSQRTSKQANELEELSDKVKSVRISEEKINKFIQQDDKTAKFAGIILFNTNSSELSETFKKDLDVLVTFLKNNPSFRIDLHGHTDDVGDDSYNEALSDRRVIAVKNYLVSKGVNPKMITLNSLGERFPQVPNTSVDNRSLNRRVEIAVLKSVQPQ